MEKLHFSTKIKASKEKVWEILWEDSSYRKWTSVFSEGSYAETDWKEGSKVLFLDGKGGGMVSKVQKKILNELMSIKHVGIVRDGVEDTESEAIREWQGAMENYTLKEVDGITELSVEVDAAQNFKGYLEETFPNALEQVKHLSENY